MVIGITKGLKATLSSDKALFGRCHNAPFDVRIYVACVPLWCAPIYLQACTHAYTTLPWESSCKSLLIARGLFIFVPSTSPPFQWSTKMRSARGERRGGSRRCPFLPFPVTEGKSKTQQCTSLSRSHNAI